MIQVAFHRTTNHQSALSQALGLEDRLSSISHHLRRLGRSENRILGCLAANLSLLESLVSLQAGESVVELLHLATQVFLQTHRVLRRLSRQQARHRKEAGGSLMGLSV